MKKTTRKSTALVSLVLVPLNLMGLGFAGGCDSRDDSTSGSFTEPTPTPSGGTAPADAGEVVDFDARDPDDPFNLDPVTTFAGGPPATQPTTQPLASSNFAHMPAHQSGAYTHYRSGGMAFIPVPIPFRPGYRPAYRGAYRAPQYGSTGYRPGYPTQRSPTPSYSRPGPSAGSSSSSSSGVSRGGFGSSGRASGAGSSGSSGS